MIIAHPDESFLGRDVSGEHRYQYISEGDGVTWTETDGASYYAGYKNANDATVVALVPEAGYYRELRHLRNATLRLFVPVITLMIVIVYFIFNSGKNINNYKGEFMTQYSWAEFTNAFLSRTSR